MNSRTKSKIIFAAVLAVALALHGQGVVWTGWTAADTNAGTASGTMGGVTVNYSGEVDQYSTVNNFGATYLWAPGSTFTNSLVPMLPGTSDIIRLGGGLGITSTLTFSTPVNDLIIDITSVGSISGTTNSFIFNQPFTILSQGGDYWRTNGTGCWLSASGNTLTGVEGSGCLYFSGPISSLSWTIPRKEMDAGFTVGMLGVPEPGTVSICLLGATTLALCRRRRG
jgi:hypothetical protein